MKHGFIASVIITFLALCGCSNYFNELIPPDENKILSFTVSGQTEPSVITENSISVMLGKETSPNSLIPEITISQRASLIPLTYEYIQAAFPSTGVFTRAAKMYTADNFPDHIFDLIREDKNFNVPAVTIPVDFSDTVNFLVISGKGKIRRYTVYVTSYPAEPEIDPVEPEIDPVEPKPVTITGLSAADKVYDGTTTATITGTAVINGLINSDIVTIVNGTASFANAAVGNNKTVTFSGFSLGGADSGKYTLSAQPASVTANITAATSTIEIEMVRITAGTFQMGSPTSEPGRYTDETQHSVTLTKGFYMGKYPVTQAQYQEVMGSNPSGFKTPVAPETNTNNRPAETVMWYSALVFCNKLSIRECLSPAYEMQTEANTAVWSTNPDTWGTIPTVPTDRWNAVLMVTGSNGYRLPTEAQWEYACRANTTTAFNNGNNDYTVAAQVGAVAWYEGNSSSRTHEVGLKTPNAWGLYDMHGNVTEWCWDRYASSYGSGAQTDPVGTSGTSRVFRGGSYNDGARNLRSATRYDGNPSVRLNTMGFRLIRPD
jgi:formylglycine-generating enzyme required for sulfatase activity